MKQYLELLHHIDVNGVLKPAARKGMPGTRSIFGYQFRHKLEEGFPLLTTKKVFWKGVIEELLWFLRGDTNVKSLNDQGVYFWNQDAYRYYSERIYNPALSQEAILKLEDGKYRLYTLEEFEELLKTVSKEDLLNDYCTLSYTLGDTGYQYGKTWRNLVEYQKDPQTDEFVKIEKDQIADLLDGLKNAPEGRRHMISAIMPTHDKDLALYWCHVLAQFNCRPLGSYERARLAKVNFDDFIQIARSRGINSAETFTEEAEVVMQKYFDELGTPKYALDCQMYQRSADMILGVPLNIASYALLTHLLCRMFGFIPGDYIHTFGDAHFYEDHKDAVAEQSQRESGQLPTIEVLPRSENGSLPDHFEKYLTGRYSLDDFFNSLTREDFKLIGYNPQSKITAKLSTGLN